MRRFFTVLTVLATCLLSVDAQNYELISPLPADVYTEEADSVVVVYEEDFEPPLMSNLELAELFNGIGSYDVALFYAQEAIMESPKEAAPYFQAGKAYYNMEDYGEAYEMLAKAIKLGKKNDEQLSVYYLFMVLCCEDMGDNSQALKFANEGLKKCKEDPLLLVQRATFLYPTDRKKAEKDIALLEKVGADDAQAMAFLGVLYLTNDEYELGLKAADRALAIDPENSVYYNLRGTLNEFLNRKEEAVSDYLMAVIIDEHEVAYESLKQLEDPSLQTLVLNQLREYEKEIPSAYNVEALLELNWHGLENAMNVYERRIEDGQAEVETYTTLAALQTLFAGRSEAFATLDRGLRQYPDDESLLDYKATLLLDVGMPDEAVELYDRIIEQGGESSEAYRNKGNALLIAGRYAEAQKTLQNAMQLETTYNPDILLNLMYVYYLQGDKTRAQAIASMITSMDEEDLNNGELSNGYYLAAAYAMNGQRLDALKQYSQVYSNDDSEFLVMIDALTGYEDQAVATLRKNAESELVSGADLLYNKFYYPLHKLPAFKEFVEDQEIGYEVDPTSGLLRMSVKIDTGDAVKNYERLQSLDADGPQELADKINAISPLDMGIVSITGAQYDKKRKKITLNVEAPKESVEVYNKNPRLKEKFEELQSLGMLQKVPKMAEFDATFEWVFTDPDKETKVVLSVTPQKIKKLAGVLKSQNELDRMNLDFWIELVNASGEEKMYFEGNNIVDEANLDEDVDIFVFEMFKSQLKENILTLFQQPGYSLRAEQMVRSGVGFIVRYMQRSSGKQIEVVLTPGEIADSIGYYGN